MADPLTDPLLEVDALEDRLQRTVAAGPASLLIDDASALIRGAVGAATLVDDDTGELAVPRALIPVIVRVVDRALVNPHGLRGEAMGGRSWQADAAAGAGGVYLTGRDVREARRACGLLPVGTIELDGHRVLTHAHAAAASGDLTGT